MSLARTMGYRKLLKEYVHHVREIAGTDFVELAALTNALSKRDLGEMRTIAAELQRESHTATRRTNLNRVVRDLLAEHQVELDQLRSFKGINPSEDGEELSEDCFRRILLAYVRAFEGSEGDSE